MIGHNAILEAMAVYREQYPPEGLPEIALAGRSNVGKSSFINCLLRRKKLAYTSSSPGKTRTVNFYKVDERFRLVDLPGYGYARASKQAQAAWAKSIDTYLEERASLREVFLLCDLRHPPTTQDRQMYDWILEAGFRGYVLATKADKVPRTKRPAHEKQIREVLGLEDHSLLLTYSAVERSGLEAVEARISSIVGI